MYIFFISYLFYLLLSYLILSYLLHIVSLSPYLFTS